MTSLRILSEGDQIVYRVRCVHDNNVILRIPEHLRLDVGDMEMLQRLDRKLKEMCNCNIPYAAMPIGTLSIKDEHGYTKIGDVYDIDFSSVKFGT